jgi:hypothetical protein
MFVDVTPVRRPISGAVVIGGLVVISVLAWWLRGAIEPAAPAPSPAPREAPVASPARTRQPLPLPAVARTTPPPRPELRGHDMADPCLPAGEPTIPAGYTTITANDITVAWSPDKPATPGPSDIALRATSVAYLVSGILEEAAALTGTIRRDSLTVVVYPAGDFTAQTGAPSWAGGAYDGAVRVPAAPRNELGVSIATLRHEVLHAQLHAAVGCVPAWFNEGTAMYFAGAVPALEWLKLLRTHDNLDLASVQSSVFVEMPADRAGRAYAISLAMVLFAIESSQGEGVQPAIRAAQAAKRDSPRAGLELWDRMFPGADDRAVLDMLAHRLFGVALGSGLDDKFRAAVCCYGLRSPSETACGTAPVRPGTRTWSDRVGDRPALCFATW